MARNILREWNKYSLMICVDDCETCQENATRSYRAAEPGEHTPLFRA
jgi:hypothetical protein